MDLGHLFQPSFAVSGLVVGFLVGLTGVGGGSLMTPLLILVFKVHPTTAVGTDLIYAGVSRVFGAAVHGVKRTVDWPVVGRLLAGSVPATLATLLLLEHFHARRHEGHGVLTSLIGAALILTALAILFRGAILKHQTRRIAGLGQRARTMVTIALGALIGVLVTISSVGAGAIGVTVLLLLYPQLTPAKLVGSDIAHAVPLALIAGAGYWAIGSVDAPMLTSLLVGSIPGIVLGSLLASRTPERILRPILASTLVLVGGRMLF